MAMPEERTKQELVTLNVRAEQVAFIGRAMERARIGGSVCDFVHAAALTEAEKVLGKKAPGKEGK